MRWIQGFINPGTLYLPRSEAEVNQGSTSETIFTTTQSNTNISTIVWLHFHTSILLYITNERWDINYRFQAYWFYNILKFVKSSNSTPQDINGLITLCNLTIRLDVLMQNIHFISNSKEFLWLSNDWNCSPDITSIISNSYKTVF